MSTVLGLGVAVIAASAAAQTVSIEYEGSYAFENEEEITFTLRRHASSTGPLAVAVTVSETGDMIDARFEGIQNVNFGAGQTEFSLPLPIVNDDVDEDHSVVSVALDAATAAHVQVRDDDGILVELGMDPLEVYVGAGGTARFDLVAATVEDGTFSAVGDLTRVFGRNNATVSWSTRVAGEAVSGVDYAVLSEEVAFRFAEFDVDVDRGRLVLRYALPAVATAFDDDEVDERFLVILERSPSLDGRFVLRPRSDIASFRPDLVPGGARAGIVTIGHSEGELRLVNGEVAHEGRLEILHNGQWGTICDDYWTDEESGVACRQMGYPGAESNTGRFLSAHFGEGQGPIWLDDVLCDGDESRVLNCPRVDDIAIGVHNCRHSEDVGIRCLPTTEQFAEVPGAGGDVVGAEKSQPAWKWPGDQDAQVLDLSGRRVSDLTEIWRFARLKALVLPGNNVSDLAPLAGLSELRSLDLSNNAIEDLWPLAGLRELRRLNLSGNHVTDLTPLASLSHLEVLLLDDNRVSDLGPLFHLTTLRKLALAHNRIADVSPLAGMAALERLDLYGNEVADLSPVAGLSDLLSLRGPDGAVAEASRLR